MLRISKKVEYALIALHYIASNEGRVVPAKEIADHYALSFDFLAKALQLLTRKRYVISQQGASGGYAMLKDPHQTSVEEIIVIFEGRPRIVDCCDAEPPCEMGPRCPIRNPMALIQRRIDEALRSMTIGDMVLTIQRPAQPAATFLPVCDLL